MNGVLYHYRAQKWNPPERYPIEDQEGRPIGQLDLAWPAKHVGVAIAEADIKAAQAQGRKVLSMQTFINKLMDQ